MKRIPRTPCISFALACLCAALVGASSLAAATTQPAFVPFQQFLHDIQSADAGSYLIQGRNALKDSASLVEMQRYVLNLYQDVHVSQSFLLGNDHFDCVPMAEQPGVRRHGLARIATPPPVTASLQPGTMGGGQVGSLDQVTAIPSQLAENDRVDTLGHSRVCATGTIPMRRVTLQELARFPSLQAYLQKTPDGAEHLPSKRIVPPQVYSHKYSYTYQNVTNIGQTDTINLWSPYVDTGADQIFSLAQSWTVGTTGTTQTAEVGWQNYPGKYGDERSRLFIYWTADGYQSTGCYNLDCSAFVQTNSSWYFGGPFSNYSTVGGAQYEFLAQYYLYQGNWWLGLGTPGNVTWVGYYPASLYGSGPMSTSAQLIEFGSESVGSTSWPAEGSGNFASAGWSYAGYQRQVWYWAPGGAAYWVSLSVGQPSPSCYTIDGPYWGGYTPPSNYWGYYFYFGGPGGTSC
ncbi:neprosin family prolyl endopeptidase [Dyella choica]|uniref:neprosin family prolyl endopeptidase n=1 Tax=Dyella choica TaxID=1927959 RepID=UPI001315829E|nr:neprosin family prolyl endopeptidase [Dyella choica]